MLLLAHAHSHRHCLCGLICFAVHHSHFAEGDVNMTQAGVHSETTSYLISTKYFLWKNLPPVVSQYVDLVGWSQRRGYHLVPLSPDTEIALGRLPGEFSKYLATAIRVW
jgi:hypothetical protein